jgi:ribosomal protein S1
MSFVQLFNKSNSSLYKLSGNVIQGAVSPKSGDLCLVDTGLKTATVCFQHELNKSLPVMTKGSPCLIGIVEPLDRFGEPQILLPKTLEHLCKRQLVWTELTKIWRRANTRRIRGFILNSVKGGYAVAIAGHIAFLPRSLRYGRYVFQSQWRWFSILNMNLKTSNIVVKEVGEAKRLRAGFRRPSPQLRLRPGLAPAGFHVASGPNQSIRRRSRRPPRRPSKGSLHNRSP